jgi:hypothetical protein
LNRCEKKVIKFLILKKIPTDMRAKMWLITSGAKREMTNNPNYYETLKNQYPKTIPSPYEKQIDMVRSMINILGHR